MAVKRKRGAARPRKHSRAFACGLCGNSRLGSEAMIHNSHAGRGNPSDGTRVKIPPYVQSDEPGAATHGNVPDVKVEIVRRRECDRIRRHFYGLGCVNVMSLFLRRARSHHISD